MLERFSATVKSDLPRPEEETGFDIHEAINFLWRQWKFIGGITGIAILVATIYIVRQTPLYTATAQLLLDPRKEKAAGQDAILTDAVLDLPAVESQIAIIKSSSLLKRVVVRERLANDPEFGSAVGSDLLSSLKSFFTRSAEPQAHSDASNTHLSSSLTDVPSELIATIENLKYLLQVSRSGQSYVLNVSLASADPVKAARLTNAIADAYVVDKFDARFDAAKRASAWLSDRLVELRQQLRESEEAVARFRADNNLVGTSQGASLSQEQLGQLNTRLVQARAETAEKKARFELLQKIESGGGNVSALPDMMTSGAIAELRKQEADLSRQEADLLARYSDRHPSVVNIRAQIADVRRSMSAEIRRLTANIQNEYQLARARQEAVEKTLREVTGQTDLDAAKAITLRELERTAAVNKSLFEDFLQRSRVTQEQSTFEARDARVITPALPPSIPSSPKKLQIILIALLLGLVTGAGGAYAMEILNAGFTTPKEIEHALELPLLASISRMPLSELSVDGKQVTMPEYPILKPMSRFSEAIRSLRSAVQMSDVDHPPRVLQVTSTIPGEGKSTLAATMAVSAAQSGQKILILDCDLRHRSTSKYFRAEKAAGLVDYLAHSAELKKCVFFDDRTGVWVFPAGARTQNPPDLLASDRLKQLLTGLRQQFDLIIVDTPPIGPVVDPIIVSHLVDKIIYVVRWASTSREMIAHSIQRLTGDRKVAGIVFNYVIDTQAQKYGKYGYAYYYGGRYYKKYYHE